MKAMFRAVLAGAFLIGNAAGADTLHDALKGAYNTSGLLEQNRALLRATDENVAQAVARLRPILSWSASRSRSSSDFTNSTTYSSSLAITASLLVYDFGQTRLGADIARENVLATRQSLLDVEQQVLLNAVQAFMNYRRAAEFVQLRNANVRLITRELRAAKDRFEVGEITRTDVALAEARLASAKAAQAAAQGDLVRAAAEYKAVVGHAPRGVGGAPAMPKVPGTISGAVNQAWANHPAMRQSQHAIRAAELAVQQAEKSYAPSLNLRGSVARDQDQNYSHNYTLELSGPIYQGGALASLTRQARARRDAERAGLHITRMGVEQNVRTSYAIRDVALASLQASQQQIAAARTAFEGIREEAALGARTTLDVLNAEQDLLDARTSRISAEIDAQVAAYTILSAMGQLTAQNLNLDVTIYDPNAYYDLAKDAPVGFSPQGRALDRVLEGIVGQ